VANPCTLIGEYMPFNSETLFQAYQQNYLAGGVRLNTVSCYLLDSGPSGKKKRIIYVGRKDSIVFVSTAAEMNKHI
jgi:hypothetical protein